MAGADRGKGQSLPEGGWGMEALLLRTENPEWLLKSQEKSKLPGHDSLLRPEEEHESHSSAKHRNQVLTGCWVVGKKNKHL